MRWQDDAIEDGAIAVGRSAEPEMDTDAVYAEIDSIAREALRRLAADFSPPPARELPQRPAEPLSSLEEAYLSAMDNRDAADQLADDSTASHRPLSSASAPPPAVYAEDGGSGLERAYLARLDRACTDEAAAAAKAQANPAWRGRDLAGSGGFFGVGRKDGAAAAAAAAADTAATSAAKTAAAEQEHRGSTGGEWADAAVRALNGAMFESLGYRGNRDNYYVPAPPRLAQPRPVPPLAQAPAVDDP